MWNSVFASYIDPANSWYVPTQEYIKIVVEEEGIYRVTAADLAAYGYDLSSVTPENLHLIYRGSEQPMFVESTAGTLEFFEFYGTFNDGAEDAKIYRDPTTGESAPDQMTNPRKSLFTKQSAYFLTWNANPGVRYSTLSNTSSASISPATSFRYEAEIAMPTTLNYGGGSEYEPSYKLNSDYVMGEGFVGLGFNNAWTRTLTVSTPFPATSPVNPSIAKTRIFGQNAVYHDYEIKLNGSSIVREDYLGIDINTHEVAYASPLSASSVFTFRGLTTGGTETAYINFLAIEYDRQFNLDGSFEIKMNSWMDENPAHFLFENGTAMDSAWAYDLTSHQRISGTVDAGAVNQELNFSIPGDVRARDIYIVTDMGLKSPLSIEDASLNNLADPTSGAEFVILTHRSLQTSAEAYANYRDTTTQNGQTTKIVYIDEIYDEFGYGSKTPLAIKRFCFSALQSWSTQPENLLIWGKGKVAFMDDETSLVPTWGYPANDMEFASNFRVDSLDLVPQIAVGRVNVNNDAEGFDYLNKVDIFEHASYASWMNEGIFMSGGDNTSEENQLSAEIQDWKSTFEGGGFGGTAHYYQKIGGTTIPYSGKSVDQAINDGAAIIQTYGHATVNEFDVDFQEADQYTNYGKFPFVMAFGCNAGNFACCNSSFSERFVLEADRGSVIFVSNTAPVYIPPTAILGSTLYTQMFDQNIGMSMGAYMNMVYSLINMEGASGAFNRNQIRLTALQGDPSLSLRSPLVTDVEKEITSNYTINSYPNPFTERITVEYNTETSGDLNFLVYNLNGQKVSELTPTHNTGHVEMNWNGQNSTGQELPSGVYLVVVTENGSPAGMQKIVKQ